jgi:RNA polymerase sigma-70 factor (ECF subfamily)
MSEKSASTIDNRWLVELHQRWQKAGRVASPAKVGTLLEETAQQWLAEEEDRKLVAAAKQGDDRAWARLLEKHTPRALHIAQSIVGDRQSAEVIVLECFEELAIHRERLQPEDGFQRLIAWITKRRSLTHAARVRQEKDTRVPISLEEALEDDAGVSLPLVQETADPEEFVIRKLIGTTVRAAVDQLPDSLRVTINYCYFGGLSYAQAGVLLGISKSAVQQRIEKAEAMLKRWLTVVMGEDAFGEEDER